MTKEELEKENAELKHTIATLRQEKDNVSMHAKAMEVVAKTRSDQLTKAKEIIKKLYEDCYSIADVEDTNLGLWEEDLNQAQQFIKEIERC